MHDSSKEPGIGGAGLVNPLNYHQQISYNSFPATTAHTQSDWRTIKTITMKLIIRQTVMKPIPQPSNLIQIQDPMLEYYFTVELDPYYIVVLGQL